MRGVATYLMAGIVILLALNVLAPSMGLGLSVNAWSVVPPGATLQYVDRTRKGDRLDMSVTTVDKRPMQTPSEPAKMMNGCDPAFSPLSTDARANFAGRCAA